MKGLKILSLCLLLGTIIALLAACGSPQDVTTTTDSSLRVITATPRDTATPTITPTPVVPLLDSGALQDVQIEFWYVWDATIPDTLADLVKQFNHENQTGIEVLPRRFSHPSDFETAMQAAIANHSTPHVVLAQPYQYNEWQTNGVLINLVPYLEHPNYGVSGEILAQFYPVMLARDRYGAEQRGFPGLISARVMLYNQSWAEDLGFQSPPSSAAGFTLQACAAHDANSDRTGGWMIDTSPGSAAAWLQAFTGGLETGNQYAFDSEDIEAAYSFLSDLRVAGCAWQPTSAYPDQAFIDRLGLFYPVSTLEINYVQQAFDQSTSKDTWTAIAYPNDLGESLVSLYGTSYVLLESSVAEQIAAWLFIREMTSEPYQLHLAEKHLYLPLSRQTSATLQDESRLPQAWLDALDLLEQAAYEPRFASWRVVRGIVQDSVAEVLDERFVPGRMSLFLQQLNELVTELDQ